MKLSANDLSWSIGGTALLQSISFDVADGEFFGIVGPNGSGKTTLMSLLSGIPKPQVGSVTLDGQPLSKIGRRDVSRSIALVEQQAETGERLTARQAVELGRTPHLGAYTPWTQVDAETVNRALRNVDMDHLAGRYWHTLSGGERQRLHIARALAQEPKVLLLDEPTNHLDIGHQIDLLDLVGKLDLTVVTALHDLNHAALFCDRIALMQNGSLVALGKPSDVLTVRCIREVFGVEAEVETIGHGSCNIRFLPRGRVDLAREGRLRAAS